MAAGSKRAHATSATGKKRARESFLSALCDGSTVTQAAEVSGFDRSSVYRWRDADVGFARAWDVAYDRGTDRLEQEAQRRAVEGVEKPVTVAGEREVVREYSDTLLIFLLKGRRPEKYARFEGKVQVTGKDGGPIEHKGGLTLGDLAAFLADQGRIASG